MKSLNNDMDLIKFLRGEELAALKLRALYGLNGYSGWRMSKFEEYEFYIRNKDFLVSENVLTFTDVNGKLMALKPDVTLSIIRHMKDEPDALRKVFYDENVYRVSGNAKSFREIKQVGVECVGAVSELEVSEVILLAAESLKLLAASNAKTALNISHLDLIAELLGKLNLDLESQNKVIKFIADKNSHGIKELCGSDELARLINLSGNFNEVMPALREIFNNSDNLNNFNKVISSLLSKAPELEDVLRIDFAALSDLNYYNGLVFQGFIEGVPARILAGGQYDKLMRRMGHKSGAVGFAVYLDMLERGVR